MGFDLFVWPVTGPVPQPDAAAELERLLDCDRPGEPYDERLRSFVAELAGEGDVGTMIMPTQFALELAPTIGPEAVAQVRTKVAEWRAPIPAKSKPPDREPDRLLDGGGLLDPRR